MLADAKANRDNNSSANQPSVTSEVDDSEPLPAMEKVGAKSNKVRTNRFTLLISNLYSAFILRLLTCPCLLFQSKTNENDSAMGLDQFNVPGWHLTSEILVCQKFC